MAIRLIAIDIDGTLLPSTGGSISACNCAALREAAARGIEIVIATGRRHAFATPLMSPAGLNRQFIIISSNGAVTRSFEGTLFERRFLPVETARKLCGELRGCGTMVFTFDREGAAALVIESLAQLNSRIERWVEANRDHLTEMDPIERAFDEGDAPIQGMVCGTVDEMRQVESRLLRSSLSRGIAMHRTEYPARDLSILDLLPPGCSKGTALHHLAQLRKLERQEIMAIGDNLNDLEMLEYAGRPVLMANAGAEMLAIAEKRRWECTPSNDEDGVAQVIHLLLGEEMLSKLSAPGGSERDGSAVMVECAK